MQSLEYKIYEFGIFLDKLKEELYLLQGEIEEMEISDKKNNLLIILCGILELTGDDN